ncbi:hypothetical protein L211DRAFT_331456 [Terfezia boudieri ATCC MYA-4762]|uniref:HTH CENPB-type domain-containing protein n=1 Tax=Terfezia boudieri ATCC MYA-4762 TaxID=1051890 RepID=A0A3N4LMK6_9PEZI|nr:hypothetical protein L211DRAFT_331456 [Terfezia boudieri ATCC MYA-4762]
MARSTISDILKDKDRWVAVNTSSGTVWKRKKRSEQYPILEKYLREWVDRANEATVNITDAILASAAGRLAGALSLEEGHPEDYSDFVFSSGWLSAFKARGGIGRQKLRGDGGEYDQALKLIPQHQAILQDKTADFA